MGEQALTNAAAEGVRRRKFGSISVLEGASAFASDGDCTGPPLVMLHGIGSNAGSFVPLIGALAGSRAVVAWDAPGYRSSSPLDIDWPTADDYADALDVLLDRLGIGRLDLLGHSLGAVIAGRFASRHPERLGCLFLVSPALGYGTQPGAALAPAAASRLDALINEGAARFAATRAPRLVHQPGDPSLIATVTQAMSEVTLPGYAQASRMLSCADLVADARLIATPTLVMVGADDQITPPANCRRLYDALVSARPDRGHRFGLIAEAGHAVVQERPADVARAIASFVRVDGS